MKSYITKEQAVALLPEGETVLTFMNGGFGLVGADWSREEIIDKIEKSDVLELTGAGARGMGHGMCAYNNGAKHSDILFIQTVEEKVKELEADFKREAARCIDESEVYANAIGTFGAEAQTLMVFEEMAELQKELCKHARGKHNTDAIAEEIADVQIMLEQMILLHDCRNMVEKAKAEKIARLAERIAAAQDE